MQRRLACLLLLIATTALVGCRATSHQTVPVPTGEQNESMCRVYLARSAQLWGKVRRVEVVDQGTPIGSLGANGYLCWDREPGLGPIQILYHGSALDVGVVESVLDFDGKAGDVYYYSVHLRKSDRKPQAELLEAEDGIALMARRSQATFVEEKSK